MKSPNVHEYTDKEGNQKFAVCQWDKHAGNYRRPLDSRERRLSGCTGEFARVLSYFGGFNTEAQARGRARTLYGYSKKSKRF